MEARPRITEGKRIAVEELKPGVYRHFKGNLYQVLGVAHHSETQEMMVVYRALYGERGLWVRPLTMWNERVSRGGYDGPRFRYVCEREEQIPK